MAKKPTKAVKAKNFDYQPAVLTLATFLFEEMPSDHGDVHDLANKIQAAIDDYFLDLWETDPNG